MQKIYNELSLGAEKEFTLVQISDIHLNETDDTSSSELLKLSEKRKIKYPFCKTVLDDSKALIGENQLIITGDMTDFVTESNMKTAKDFVDSSGALFVCGNHDFRPFGGMQYDVPKVREVNFEKVSTAYNNDIRFFSKVINGVNIVGIDDCYYRFEDWQYSRLETEVQRGLPIILALHVPLYNEACYDLMITEKRRYASLVAVPEEKLAIYPPERYIQQKEDAITRKMYDYILACPLIKAVICGHVHKNFETDLNGKKQFITGTDTARIIKIK